MKQNRRRRLISLMMVFAMLLSYIPGAVWAADASTDIKAIEKPTGISIVEDYDDYVGDNWLEKLGLPGTVKVTLADNTKQEVPVAWDTGKLDTRTTGYYSLPGTISLPAGATNEQNLTVTITVQVRKYSNLLFDPSFEQGSVGWRRITKNSDPAHITDGEYSAYRTVSDVGKVNAQVTYQNNHDKNPADATNYAMMLAAAMKAAGAGQYYFSYDGKSGAESLSYEMRLGFDVWTKPTYNGTGTLIASVDNVAMPLINEKFATVGGVFEFNGQPDWVRTDVKVYGPKGSLDNGITVYMDNAQLVPLKVALQAEPAAIEEIKTEILSRAVVLNYPDYVGADWKGALGLPEKVTVLTDAGTTAEVDVTWSYAGLDFTKYGKYTLVGKLDDSGFPNPKGLTVQQDIFVTKAKSLLANGDFNDGTQNWKGGKSRTGVADPKDANNKVLLIKHYDDKVIIKDDGNQSLYTSMDKGALADAINAQGSGQYVLQIKAKPAAFDEQTPARTDLRIRIYLRFWEKADSAKAFGSYTSDYAYMTSTDEWTTCRMVMDIEQGAFGGYRTDAYCTSLNKDLPGALYVDDFELIPVNVTIPKGQEPAEIKEIISEIPVRAVVKDYNKYVGSAWQTEMDLPKQVEVRTSNGNTALVDVTWNFDTMDLSQVGKYVLVGTLDNSTYPNPGDLHVTQTVYVREYKNLIPNPSFESGLTGWYLRGAGTTRVTTPVKDGKYAGLSGTWTPDKTNKALADTRDIVDELAKSITMQGAGQYYFSFWSRANIKTVPEGMQMRTWFMYKTKDPATGELSESTRMEGELVSVSNQKYVQSAGIIDMPKDVAWARMDMYFFVQQLADFENVSAYFDHAELIPLNIIVDRYEGEMEQVETVIPQRRIIQNYQDYVGGSYTVADLMLPEYVKVRSTAGEVIDIAVSWDISKLDLTKVGTYRIPGALDAMRLDNPKGISVEQVIQVVAYKNLLTNPSFEDYGDGWHMGGDASSELGIMKPVKHGSLSMQMTVDRLNLEAFDDTNIHAMWCDDAYDFGLRIAASGAGQYYFGGWAQGQSSSLDTTFYTRFWYRCYDNGDSATSFTGPKITPSLTEYLSSGGIITIPGDIYWSRVDCYIGGEPSAMSMSSLYVDHMEFIPLNVEVPNMNDLVNCETVANTYVHQGTKFEDLGLPETLEVVLKNGQYYQMGVKWDKAAYDPNKLGQQTITGTLELGTKFKNSKNFVPTTVVTVRAKGEDLRQTIYFSTSGNDANDGLSPAMPKKDITKMATYLAQGYNIKLKSGDTWYLPIESLTYKHLYGTEKAPLTVTSYGDGARPIIGFMMKIENNQWRLVDEKRNIYAADVSILGQRGGESVHRAFIDGESYFHKTRNTYVSLDEKEFCSYSNNVYIRLPQGEVPRNVEVTSHGNGGVAMIIQDVSYLTFENLHIKGGRGVFSIFEVDAPTKFLKVTQCSITYHWMHLFEFGANDERINYKPEVSYLTTDSMVSQREGALSGYYGTLWDPHSLEGVTMRDGVEGAWIHHNHFRQLGHCYVAIESLDCDEEYNTRGVFNCYTEDNVFEAGYVLYARPFTMSGALNLSGTQLCRDNTFRRNRCYDMSVAGHYFGENNLVYSNLFSFLHTTYNEDGTLFDGKSAKSYGFNTDPWNGKSMTGNIAINNTFYDVTGVAFLYDQGGTVFNNLYANNLVVNWKSDPKQDEGATGAFFVNAVGLNYFMNNGLYSHFGDRDHFNVNGKMYTAAEVNNAVAGFKANIAADPKFVDADLSLLGKGVRQEFELGSDSPMRYAGMSLYDPIFETFPAWERLKAEYTDINGVPYLAESPSIGAYSYSELIRGDVAEVGKLEDVLCRPGATIDQLQLPDAVPAVNDKGIDVMLLVTWDTATFDSSKPGTVTLTGELRNGPHTDLNINGKTASININIKDKLELMNIVTRVDMLTVLHGTTFEGVIAQLPAALEVVEESGFEEALPVSWTCKDYDGNKPGDYTFKCILPENMLTNVREFDVEVTVRVMHELGRGVELLINPDFIDGGSASPWKLGWLNGQYGNYRITTDPELLPEGEPAGAIVTVSRRYASIQQDVVGQMKLMGDGKYLFRMKMRAYDPAQPIDTSYPCLKQEGTAAYTYRCRPRSNIGEEYVEYYQIMNVYDVDQATEIIFHTSTMKSFEDAEDGPRSYIIAGCSLIYLGKTDAEMEATLDSIDLTWNAIKGENTTESNVMSDLKLPSSIGAASTIKWTSSDESAITNDGKVTMGRVSKTVTMTATITYKGKATIKKFMVTVPRDPSLPTFSGSLTGSQKAQVGDEVSVTIKLNAENATAFNAYRFTLSYNVTRLEYVGISDPASTVELDGGRVIISGIGAERPITDTITVTFKVLKSGVTEVKLVKVEMDIDPNASLDNLPTMTVTDGAASIDVEKSENDKQDSSKPTVESGKKDDSAVLWIVIGLVAAALIAGGVIAIILIKKKKQLPPATEE